MDSRTQERVERWESRPYGGGRDELATLADEEFSGAITAAGTWLFMLNGRIVGVVDGDVTAAADASGTIYEAPADALPLLMAMLEQGGETRGTYYTNETPLTEVDRKLQQGSFTGYVELSEQVLSGDYYAVYYGGRRMSAAYIGNAERLLTGEEAFERADDEIGLYKVVTVDVSVTDVPGRDGPNETPSPADAADATGDVPDDAESTADTDPTSTTDAAPSAGDQPSATDEPTGTPREGTAAGDEGGEILDDSTAETEVAYAEADDPDASPSEAASESAEPGTAPSRPRAGTDTADEPAEPDDEGGITTTSDVTEPETSGITTPVEDADPAGDEEEEEPDERFKEEERWRETRQIPSIDPENTSDDSVPANAQSTANARSDPSAAGGRTERQSAQRGRSGGGNRGESADRHSKSGPSPEDVASTEQALRSELEREDKVDQLIQRVTELEERRKQLVRERDELESENQELTDLVERLQDRIEELEAKLERARTEASATESTPSDGAGTTAESASESVQRPEITLSPQQAYDQTNVFVRYESKSQPTLESAHDGEGSRGDLARNLQLERHTQFDASTAAVDGQPYESFVEESIRYRFVEWLVGTCLFEIRETGHADGFADLYDVIPRIDRIELSATISLEEDDTENVPDQVTFDVAAFDKRGTPLVVANCNDSRDPATRGMLEQLEADASAVCANYPDLGAAVIVTSSFFDPGALDLVEDITSSGFLNRSSKLSYVSLSRKQGYHCCLIESRSGGFHLSVPEL